MFAAIFRFGLHVLHRQSWGRAPLDYKIQVDMSSSTLIVRRNHSIYQSLNGLIYHKAICISVYTIIGRSIYNHRPHQILVTSSIHYFSSAVINASVFSIHVVSSSHAASSTQQEALLHATDFRNSMLYFEGMDLHAADWGLHVAILYISHFPMGVGVGVVCIKRTCTGGFL